MQNKRTILRMMKENPEIRDILRERVDEARRRRAQKHARAERGLEQDHTRRVKERENATVA